jgi:dipeptidyl aminopeptidase/acylaminoacyl peptidase
VKNIFLISFVAALVLVTLACGTIAPTAAPTSNVEDVLATQVAGTLTALATVAPEPATAKPPEASPTSAPTPPPAPQPLRVAYVKDGNVWLWTDGFGAAQLTAIGSVQEVRLSDDGQVLAYVRESIPFEPEIYAINRDGSGDRLLVGAADFLATYSGDPAYAPNGIGVYQMDWRPGSHELYYNTRPLFEGPGLGCYNDLRAVNADTLAQTVFFGRDEGGLFYFSPDGAQLALVTPTSVSLANADGSNLRRDVLTFDSVITYSEYLYYPHPVWATDSSGLRIAIPPADPMLSPLPPTSLWYLPIDGSPAIFSGTIQAMLFAWPDTAISPDLNRVGYARPFGSPSDNLRELHLANADASGDTFFTSGEGVEFLGWLPDSTQFVFVMRGSDAMSGVHIGSLGSGYTTISSDPAMIRDIRWVDSTRFIYLWHSGDNWELRTSVLGGGGMLLDSGQIGSYDYSN